jgi:hypothetical protein
MASLALQVAIWTYNFNFNLVSAQGVPTTGVVGRMQGLNDMNDEKPSTAPSSCLLPICDV